jgi:molecular chaperone DnaK (HSP70)
VIFSLGGAYARAALVRRGRSGAFELLDRAELAGSGADDLDDLLLAHVRARIGGPGRWDDLSAGVAALRDECGTAKERLSTADEAAVAVDLPWSRTRVTVTRSDFEDLIRPVVETFAALAVRVASGRPEGLVLLGGATRIPLVADSVAEALSCPPATQPEPEHTAALGAALAAIRMVSRAPAAPPMLAGLDLPGPPSAPAERTGSGQPPRPPIDISPLELPARVRRIPLQRRASEGSRRHSRSAR